MGGWGGRRVSLRVHMGLLSSSLVGGHIIRQKVITKIIINTKNRAGKVKS